MSYRVRYFNPATKSGFIEGYRLARVAKGYVEKFNALYDRDGCGIRAEYLGNSDKEVPKPKMPETTGVWSPDRDRHGILRGWYEMFPTDDGRLVSIPDSSRYIDIYGKVS